MKKTRWMLVLGVLAGSAFTTGCTTDDAGGTGTAQFTTWGEEYIEVELPAEKMEDGWRITYQKMLVVIGRISIADQAGEVAASSDNMYLFDHTKPGVKPIETFANLEAKAWDEVSYEISPAPADVIVDASASEADKQFMVDNGYADYIEATATKGDQTFTMAWGVDYNTRYTTCAGPKEGKETEGSVVTNGGVDSMELTIHGDHYFFDDLQAANAKNRYDAIAGADADMDGEVTLAELDAVDLTTLPAGQYGTGAAGNINTLGDYVRALSRTIGHFRGEGECFAEPR
jgi:hypothetical protein